MIMIVDWPPHVIRVVVVYEISFRSDLRTYPTAICITTVKTCLVSMHYSAKRGTMLRLHVVRPSARLSFFDD